MRMKDLTKNISEMTDDELRAHVQHIRHTKYVAKPAKAKIVKDIVEKPAKKKAASVDKSIAKMSAAERQQLLLLLEGGE